MKVVNERTFHVRRVLVSACASSLLTRNVYIYKFIVIYFDFDLMKVIPETRRVHNMFCFCFCFNISYNVCVHHVPWRHDKATTFAQSGCLYKINKEIIEILED